MSLDNLTQRHYGEHMPSDFSLHAYVSDFLDQADEPDPVKIAHLIADQLPEEQLRQAVHQLLPTYIRAMVTRMGMHSRRDLSTTDILHPVTPDVRSIRTTPTSREMIAQTYAMAARKVPYCVSDDHIYKHLNDCTIADIRYIAASRYEKAAQNQAVAEKFDKLVLIMEEISAETVADLPDDALQSAMTL